MQEKNEFLLNDANVFDLVIEEKLEMMMACTKWIRL